MTIAVAAVRSETLAGQDRAIVGTVFCDMIVSSLFELVISVRLPSAVAAMALQDFDFVSVGVFNEEEPRHQRPFAIEFLDRIDLDSGSRHARMFGVKIVDRECDMAVSRARSRRAPCDHG